MRRYNSSSRLIGLLQTWTQADPEASRQDWAERLSRWLGPMDAISLHAAHQALPSRTSALSDAQDDDLAALSADTDRARMALLQAAEPTQAAAPGLPRSRGSMGMPRPPSTGQATDAPEFATFRQRYLAHQRSMELRLPPLRERCRRVLSHAAPRLHQIAELDSALERILGDRERALLSKVPALLERRFEHWRASSIPAAWPAPPDGPAPAVVSTQPTPPTWLTSFTQDFHEVMRAEVDFRMAPIHGLIDALNNTTERSQA